MAVRKRRPAPREPFWKKYLKGPEFRPDTLGSGLFSKLYITRQQRMTLLRWGSLALTCLVGLILQDTIFSRLSILGATTDIPACLILLITVLEGTETGSVFALLASTFYYFTGSAPGPYCVGALTALGMLASLVRQVYWHRSKGAILLCASTALMLYEVAVFGFSLFSGLTHWGRAPRFLVTGLISCLLMIPLYSLVHKLGRIGGHTWKE